MTGWLVLKARFFLKKLHIADSHVYLMWGCHWSVESSIAVFPGSWAEIGSIVCCLILLTRGAGNLTWDSPLVYLPTSLLSPHPNILSATLHSLFRFSSPFCPYPLFSTRRPNFGECIYCMLHIMPLPSFFRMFHLSCWGLESSAVTWQSFCLAPLHDKAEM